MRFVHTSDLHLGKRLHEMPLVEDQRHILGELRDAVRETQAQALVVAGDVFDNPNPPDTAMRMWDDFITGLARDGVELLVVSGNHDSGTRLAMGGRLMRASGVHVAGPLAAGEDVASVTVGGVRFWLVPFVRPADVRAWAQARELDASEVHDYTDALRLVLDQVRSTPGFSEAPEVCVAHQFVTAGGALPLTSDSERLSIGTLDNVDVSAFEGFCYVALGHIHRPQRIGADPTVRYSGTPLKYSRSEVGQVKSMCVVDVDPDGTARVQLRPFEPLRDFREVRGTLDELDELAAGEDERARQDFVSATITDEMPLDVMERLRRDWPNVVEAHPDNLALHAAGAAPITDVLRATGDRLSLFADFFEEQAGRPLTEGERAVVAEALEDAGAAGGGRDGGREAEGGEAR
jgi:exonuclease SbcD